MPLSATRRRENGAAGSTSKARRIGYASATADEREVELQALRHAGCDAIHRELEPALAALRPGDTLAVWRLDRLGRTVSELVHALSDLQSRGAGVVTMVEQIDQGEGDGLIEAAATLARFERSVLAERTRAGLKAAKDSGRRLGRPRVIDDERKLDALKAQVGARKLSKTKIAKLAGISRTTLYNYLSK
jgi:DNA invertase Pin-like site-specific DNA recombinase